MTHQTNEELREKILAFVVCAKGLECSVHDATREIMSLISQSQNPQQEQLEVFNCPACPNQGWYTDGELNQNTGECEEVQVQCEFCYTHPQSVFNYMAKVKVSNFIVTNEPEGE